MALDTSWISYFMPLFGFLLVFVVTYAVLIKTKILGEGNFMNSFVAFIFAIIFVSFAPGVDYIATITPWIVILLICLFFVLVAVGLSQKKLDDFLGPGIGRVVLALAGIIFFVSAIVVFGPWIDGWLPGQDTPSGANSFLVSVKDFFYSEAFIGALVLIGTAAIASWILTKKN